MGSKREDAALEVGKVMLMLSDMNEKIRTLQQELDAEKKASSYWFSRFDALRNTVEKDQAPTTAQIGGSCND